MPTRRRYDPDDGSATVLTAGAVAALLVVATLLFALGAAMVTRHHAAHAADLAALSAAGHVDDGRADACAKARSVARRMGARLRDCQLRGRDVLVRVTLAPGGMLGRFGAVHARARAGPVVATRQGGSGVRHATSGTSGG